MYISKTLFITENGSNENKIKFIQAQNPTVKMKKKTNQICILKVNVKIPKSRKNHCNGKTEC